MFYFDIILDLKEKLQEYIKNSKILFTQMPQIHKFALFFFLSVCFPWTIY